MNAATGIVAYGGKGSLLPPETIERMQQEGLFAIHATWKRATEQDLGIPLSAAAKIGRAHV